MTAVLPTPVPLDFEAVQNALHSWASTSTGIQAIWAHQSAPRPDYPYITLEITAGPNQLAHKWQDPHTFDDTLPDGEQLYFEASVPCEFTLDLQAFVLRPDSRNPVYNAQQYLLRAMADLQTTSRRAALKAADVALISVAPPQNVPVIIEDSIVSRAIMSTRFTSSFNITWYDTYIESVRLFSDDFDIDTIVDGS